MPVSRSNSKKLYGSAAAPPGLGPPTSFKPSHAYSYSDPRRGGSGMHYLPQNYHYRGRERIFDSQDPGDRKEKFVRKPDGLGKADRDNVVPRVNGHSFATGSGPSSREGSVIKFADSRSPTASTPSLIEGGMEAGSVPGRPPSIAPSDSISNVGPKSAAGTASILRTTTGDYKRTAFDRRTRERELGQSQIRRKPSKRQTPGIWPAPPTNGVSDTTGMRSQGEAPKIFRTTSERHGPHARDRSTAVRNIPPPPQQERYRETQLFIPQVTSSRHSHRERSSHSISKRDNRKSPTTESSHSDKRSRRSSTREIRDHRRDSKDYGSKSSTPSVKTKAPPTFQHDDDPYIQFHPEYLGDTLGGGRAPRDGNASETIRYTRPQPHTRSGSVGRASLLSVTEEEENSGAQSETIPPPFTEDHDKGPANIRLIPQSLDSPAVSTDKPFVSRSPSSEAASRPDPTFPISEHSPTSSVTGSAAKTEMPGNNPASKAEQTGVPHSRNPFKKAMAKHHETPLKPSQEGGKEDPPAGVGSESKAKGAPQFRPDSALSSLSFHTSQSFDDTVFEAKQKSPSESAPSRRDSHKNLMYYSPRQSDDFSFITGESTKLRRSTTAPSRSMTSQSATESQSLSSSEPHAETTDTGESQPPPPISDNPLDGKELAMATSAPTPTEAPERENIFPWAPELKAVDPPKKTIQPPTRLALVKRFSHSRPETDSPSQSTIHAPTPSPPFRSNLVPLNAKPEKAPPKRPPKSIARFFGKALDRGMSFADRVSGVEEAKSEAFGRDSPLSSSTNVHFNLKRSLSERIFSRSRVSLNLNVAEADLNGNESVKAIPPPLRSAMKKPLPHSSKHLNGTSKEPSIGRVQDSNQTAVSSPPVPDLNSPIFKRYADALPQGTITPGPKSHHKLSLSSIGKSSSFGKPPKDSHSIPITTTPGLVRSSEQYNFS